MNRPVIERIVVDDAPAGMNVYRTASTTLDPLAAVLLIWRRPVGLALGSPGS